MSLRTKIQVTRGVSHILPRPSAALKGVFPQRVVPLERSPLLQLSQAQQEYPEEGHPRRLHILSKHMAPRRRPLAYQYKRPPHITFPSVPPHISKRSGHHSMAQSKHLVRIANRHRSCPHPHPAQPHTWSVEGRFLLRTRKHIPPVSNPHPRRSEIHAHLKPHRHKHRKPRPARRSLPAVKLDRPHQHLHIRHCLAIAQRIRRIPSFDGTRALVVLSERTYPRLGLTSYRTATRTTHLLVLYRARS